MAWRKWLVRVVVFSLFGGMVAAALLYQRWTNPEAVRLTVVSKLGEQIPGAVVTLGSAHLRLLGGIAIQDLRLARTDDASKVAFAQVPSAVIYHDKEQLIDGRVAIRKVELYRPRLHLIRRPDGDWNLAGIFAAGGADTPIPTIAIQQGTVILEDLTDAAGPHVVEITDVNLTAVNDPLPQVTFKGRGKTDVSGTVSFEGTWQRTTNAFTLALKAPDIALGGPLVQCASRRVPKLAEHMKQLEGRVGVVASVAYQPESLTPWSHDLQLTIREGKLRHPQVPLPLEQIEASLRCKDGELRLENLTARSGETKISLSGWGRLASSALPPPPRVPRIEAITPRSDSLVPDNTDFEGDLTVERLQVNSELFTKLPASVHKINHQYAPRGPVNITCKFGCTHGKWKARFAARPQQMIIAFHKFPYPVENVTGVVEQEIDEAHHVDVMRLDFIGYANGRPVYVKGDVDGEGARPAVDIRVWGDDLTIDSRLWAALPVQHQKLVKLDDPLRLTGGPVCPGPGQPAPCFHVAGRLNFQAFVRRAPGAPECACRYIVTFHHSSLRYDVFPYPLENVAGVLDIQEDHWEFRDFTGTHKGGQFFASGRCQPHPTGDRIGVDLRGGNVLLDDELAAALDPELKKTWNSFHPAGRINFRAVVDSVEDQPPEVDVSVAALGCSVKPDFFSYALTDLTGNFRYVKRWVQLEKLRAHHGKTLLTIDTANAYIKPEGGYWVDLVYLRGSPIQVDDDLLRAVPPVLGAACRELHLKDPFTLKTHLTIDAGKDEKQLPILYWDGELGLKDASMYAGVPIDHMTGKLACRGRYDGDKLDRIEGNLAVAEATILKQPFQNIQTQIEVTKEAPDVLVLPGLRAAVYGGEAYGAVRVEFGPELKYVLNLSASRLNLEEFSRHILSQGAPVSGNADVRLYLTGKGTDLQSLRGEATVDIPQGRLYNLPVLLDLLKFLGLRLPDRTAFEEAHASCRVVGERVSITRLDLYGNSISLRGQGEMKLDGSTIDLDFYAVWSRMLELLPPVIKDLPPTISKHMLRIKMTGRMGDVKCTKEFVPVLVDPARGLLETLMERRRRMSEGR
jgi:hypothetical protein